MFLIGEIGGRRQRARVSSARMHAVGRRTMYVRIPGLHGPARWAILTASQAIAHTRSARLARSLRPAWDWGARNPGCDVSWVSAGVANFSSPASQAGTGNLDALFEQTWWIGNPWLLQTGQSPFDSPSPITRSNDFSRETRNHMWM